MENESFKRSVENGIIVLETDRLFGKTNIYINDFKNIRYYVDYGKMVWYDYEGIIQKSNLNMKSLFWRYDYD